MLDRRASNNACTKALQQRRKEIGECVRCSTIKKPTYALQGHTSCSACLERMAEYAKYGKEEE